MAGGFCCIFEDISALVDGVVTVTRENVQKVCSLVGAS
jgi:hypothetical protein